MDELPQFWNVLKGDMASLVPGRRHFIAEIGSWAPLPAPAQSAARHHQLGTGEDAENVDQMVRRLKYDILYIENMSLAVDLKDPGLHRAHHPEG